MYIDANTKFSSAQALTTTAVSTNYLDGTAAGRSLEDAPYLVVRVGTALAAGTSVAVQLQTATDSAFTTPIVLYDSGAILTAALTANKEIVKVVIPIMNVKQYLRLNYVIVGTYTSGTVDAFLTEGVYAPVFS